MDNVLNKTIGGRQRKLIIIDVKINKVETRIGILAEKLILSCKSPEGLPFEIDEALVKDNRDGEIKSKGLWVSTDEDGHIRANSVIAKLLQHYNSEVPNDLTKKEIMALPKRNNYLAAVIDSDVTDDTLPW